jgi:hypothetical protein
LKFKATVTERKTLSINNKVAYSAYLDTFEVGTLLDVEIAKERKPRSLSQNRLLWALFEEIDKIMGNGSKDYTKWLVLCQIGHCDEHEFKGVTQKFPRTTSKLSKAEFTELIEKIIRFGVIELGEDLTPITSRGY